MISTNEWSWTAIYKCDDCEEEFYVTNKNGSDPNFCPFCASRNLSDIEDEE